MNLSVFYTVQNLSPLIRFANWRSLDIIVTRFAWIAHRFVSSNSDTRYASAAYWRAITADDWNRNYDLNSWAIYRTSLWNGNFLINRSVDFWYFLISRKATVPGLNLCGRFTPVVTGADFLAIFCAINCFLGSFWAVDFLAVCFVRAILLRFFFFEKIIIIHQNNNSLHLYCAISPFLILWSPLKWTFLGAYLFL